MYRNLTQSITTFALAIGLIACSGDDGTTGGSGSTSAGSSTGSSSTGDDSASGTSSGSTGGSAGSSTGTTGGSSTGGATTGTDTGTGTGTTGGANACEACVQEKCATEVEACAADQVCACWQECFMQPGSTEESCTMECGMPSAAFQDLATCVVSSCTQECQ